MNYGMDGVGGDDNADGNDVRCHGIDAGFVGIDQNLDYVSPLLYKEPTKNFTSATFV